MFCFLHAKLSPLTVVHPRRVTAVEWWTKTLLPVTQVACTVCFKIGCGVGEIFKSASSFEAKLVLQKQQRPLPPSFPNCTCGTNKTFGGRTGMLGDGCHHPKFNHQQNVWAQPYCHFPSLFVIASPSCHNLDAVDSGLLLHYLCELRPADHTIMICVNLIKHAC